jgi:hypothetical protein
MIFDNMPSYKSHGLVRLGGIGEGKPGFAKPVSYMTGQRFWTPLLFMCDGGKWRNLGYYDAPVALIWMPSRLNKNRVADSKPSFFS